MQGGGVDIKCTVEVGWWKNHEISFIGIKLQCIQSLNKPAEPLLCCTVLNSSMNQSVCTHFFSYSLYICEYQQNFMCSINPTSQILCLIDIITCMMLLRLCFFCCSSVVDRHTRTSATAWAVSHSRDTKAVDEARQREEATDFLILVTLISHSVCHLTVIQSSGRVHSLFPVKAPRFTIPCKCHKLLVEIQGTYHPLSLCGSKVMWCGVLLMYVCVYVSPYVLLAERHPIRMELSDSCPACLSSRLLS